MAFIAFLGCDGSGKTTVIERVVEEFSRSGTPVARGHWRPDCLKFSRRRVAESQIENPRNQIPRGKFASIIKLGWIWINWWIGWFFHLRGASRRGHVVFDRYHVDLTIDPIRYRYGGPGWFARFLVSKMPQPDMVFYLDAPADVLLSRKQEVDPEDLQELRNGYLRLCMGRSDMFVIDANRAPYEITRDVVDRIRKFAS